MGLSVVIATNPIYPERAVLQRMAWADLPTDLDNFEFVTNAQNMHYIKPSPMYYAELLGRIGLEPDEVILVGDSVTNDIEPARLMGITTFHVTQKSSSPGDYFGTLDYFCQLVSSDPRWLNSIERKPLHPEMIEIEYRGNIAALYGLAGKCARGSLEPAPDSE